jgi:hypothetical protein
VFCCVHHGHCSVRVQLIVCNVWCTPDLVTLQGLLTVACMFLMVPFYLCCDAAPALTQSLSQANDNFTNTTFTIVNAADMQLVICSQPKYLAGTMRVKGSPSLASIELIWPKACGPSVDL